MSAAVSWRSVFAVSLLSVSGALADVPPPLHEPPLEEAGTHPRLFFDEADEAALRVKVNASNSFANLFFSKVLTHTTRPAWYVPGYPGTPNPCPTSPPDPCPYLPTDEFETLDASPPLLAVLHADPVQRDLWGKYAVEASLAIIKLYDPPYPETTEWLGRAWARWIVLTYDTCYDQIVAYGKVQEFQDEIQRIASAHRFLANSGNHGIAFSSSMAMGALAIEGDVTSGITRTVVNEPVVHRRLFNATPPPGESNVVPADFTSYREIDRAYAVEVRLTPGGVPIDPASNYETGFPHQSFKDWDLGGIQSAGYSIKWKPGAPDRPAQNVTYYVTYRFTPNVPRWQDLGRRMVQLNLDRLWADGAAEAGVFYGSWTLNWLADLFEAYRRNTPFDFSTHPHVQDAVKWLPSELLSIETDGFRANNRNDSHYTQLDAPFTASPYFAWVMKQYPGDPDRAKVANWILRKSPRWTENVSYHSRAPWREALWVTEAFGGGAAAPDPIDLPLSRFFRGHNLVNARSGAWDSEVDDWSLFSLMSGSWMGEHDQIDRGSFTFRAFGEDFAIDTGYAFDVPLNNRTHGHNYVLIDWNGNPWPATSQGGQPGPFSHAEVRTSFLTNAFDAVQADLKKSWVSAESILYNFASYPVVPADRSALVVKVPGRAPYVLLKDSIARVDGPHTFEWGMHTQVGNVPATTASGFTIEGANHLANLSVTLTAATGLQYGTPTWPAGYSINWPYPLQFPAHPRVYGKTQTTVSNPHFAAILAPNRVSEPIPIVPVPTSGGGKTSTVISLPGNLSDRVLFNQTDGLSVSANGVETDGGLALVRTNASNQVQFWVVFDATFLRYAGATLWSVALPVGVRGTAGWDGATLHVGGDEIKKFQAYVASAATETFRHREFTLPSSSAGGLLTWEGTRRLADTQPTDVDAYREDFTSTTAQYFEVLTWQKGDYNRVVNGEYCSQPEPPPFPGIFVDNSSHALSLTRRIHANQRADIAQYPRTQYGDATLRGKFVVHATISNRNFRIHARANDLGAVNAATLLGPFPDSLDTNAIRIEIAANGAVTLLKTSGWTGSTENVSNPPLATGSMPSAVLGSHTYELSVLGDTVVFNVDGSQVLQYTGSAGFFPPRGYFGWEVPAGWHVHLDDVRITLPGQTIDYCPDVDGDGWDVCEGDCNDADPGVNPGQSENCGNGIDDDCDGTNDPECCQTVYVSRYQCLYCENSENFVCGPGYKQLCCY